MRPPPSSYEVILLYAKYPNNISKILSITGINRERVKSHDSLLYHLTVVLNGYTDPVQWTTEEDNCLIQGVNNYQFDLISVKEPLYGRSLRSCARRYEELMRPNWTSQQDQALLNTVNSIIPTNIDMVLVDWENLASNLAQSNNNKTPLQCMLRFKVITTNPGYSDPDFNKMIHGSPNLRIDYAALTMAPVGTTPGMAAFGASPSGAGLSGAGPSGIS